MIVLFCVLVSIVALLDFILLLFWELISGIFSLFSKIQYRRQRFHNKRRNERR